MHASIDVRENEIMPCEIAKNLGAIHNSHLIMEEQIYPVINYNMYRISKIKKSLSRKFLKCVWFRLLQLAIRPSGPPKKHALENCMQREQNKAAKFVDGHNGSTSTDSICVLY